MTNRIADLPVRAETESFGADFSAPARDLRVAAITPFTTIDFPGKLSAVVFVQGCPWKCGYCQNDWMQSRSFPENLAHESWEAVAKLLAKRRGLLDAVVFSGGEPAMDPALPAAVKSVKEDYGMLAGLHTGGAYPRRVKDVLPMLDWVGLDVKAPPEDAALFDRVTGRRGSSLAWRETFDAVTAAGVSCECRTTAHPDLLAPEDLLKTARWLAARGVKNYALQIYRRPPGAIFTAMSRVPSDYPGPAVEAEMASLFPRFTLRRN